MTDITERKAAEEKIRGQEAELRQTLDFAPQLTAVFGPSRERLHINRIALDYLGLSLEEWRQTRAWDAFEEWLDFELEHRLLIAERSYQAYPRARSRSARSSR